MYTVLENSILRIIVSSIGAELKSIRTINDGCEYLWQGDDAVWGESAPNLFPICGRLKDGLYLWQGKTYRMGLHGFLRGASFHAVHDAPNRVVLTMNDTDETRAQYPFRFLYRLTYQLDGNRIQMLYHVENVGEDVLPFSIGAHPGFRVPIEPQEAFDSYYLEFSDVSNPKKLLLTGDGFCKGGSIPFPLEEGKILRLSHEVFDQEDSLFLHDVPDTVVLKSRTSNRRITIHYPDMRYLGLWQMPNVSAPYLCIEPWYGSPSAFDRIDDFSVKSDMIRLLPNQCYDNVITITVDWA